MIAPTEVAVLERIVRRRPKPHHYRVRVHGNDLEAYERSGPEAEDLAAIFGARGLRPARLHQLRADLDRHARWTAVLRFQLADSEQRTFGWSGAALWAAWTTGCPLAAPGRWQTWLRK